MKTGLLPQEYGWQGQPRTLGYGDITPATRGAEALCQTEAIFGQFLTVVLVARLVGIQVAQESTTDNDGS